MIERHSGVTEFEGKGAGMAKTWLKLNIKADK